jgi:hypothetical protein
MSITAVSAPWAGDLDADRMSSDSRGRVDHLDR